MQRGLHVALAIVFGCITTVASAMAPKKPSSPLTAHIQTTTQLKTLETLEMPLSAPTAAPPIITAPETLTPLGFTYLLTPRGQQGPRITFPANAATAQAIRRLASRSVSSGVHRCARTMREAMGWGLGDAHQWLKLDDMGFSVRAGRSAQPGDIIVWPFTFGRAGSQHIGIAVGTDSGPRLLSNLSGSICLSAIVPGYRAFYKYDGGPSAPLPDVRSGLVQLPAAPAPEG